jgi:hypothetical protein
MRRIIPIYSSRGEAEAFLVFPHLYNRSGEWIGWVTPKREVYSVLGYFVGDLSDDARILRKRVEDEKPRLQPPSPPTRIVTPISVPLAPLMKDLPFNLVDVLQDEPELLHTLDSGELKQDID